LKQNPFGSVGYLQNTFGSSQVAGPVNDSGDDLQLPDRGNAVLRQHSRRDAPGNGL
jgi:hypothetical protein